MPTNDAEVFRDLISDKESTLEIDFLAYAMFAHRKSHWIDHFEKNRGRKPNQAEMEAWIGELTPFDYSQMREEAAEFFDDASREYLRDYVEGEKKAAIDNSIVAEVKSYTSPWKHLGIALLMAILAPVMLGGLVFLWSLFEGNLPFHIVVGRPEAVSHQ